MKKRLGVIFQYLFFFGLGIFLIWWSIKDLDKEKWAQINYALSNARFWLIGPVFFILISSHYVRALRWRLLVEPMGYMPDKTNMFFAVMIGYLTNQALPRFGEIVRCTVLARYEKVPVEKLIGTIILERLIDAICLLFVFFITLVIQPGLYSQITDQIFNSSSDIKETKKITLPLVAIIVIGIIALIIGAWMIIKKKTIQDIIALLKKVATRVWEGLAAIRHLRKRKQFLFLTVLLWALYLAGGYIGFLSFRETDHYGIKEAFSVLSAGSIGMIVTPGGIGAYAYLIQGTMEIYGLKTSIATAFGWLLWLAQTFVVLFGGLVSFILLPWYNRKKAAKAKEKLNTGSLAG